MHDISNIENGIGSNINTVRQTQQSLIYNTIPSRFKPSYKYGNKTKKRNPEISKQTQDSM